MTSELTLPFGWSVNKWLLILMNIFAGIVLLLLSHTNVFPLEGTNFFFFTFVGFLFALYRPGWAFLLLVGMLPYENMNMAPEAFGITLRPYQWLLVLVSLALFVRLALRRFPLDKFIPSLWDMAIVLFAISAFVSAYLSDQKTIALKLSVILCSFIVLYFVTRIFVRSLDDARMLLPFMFSSFLVVSIYALVQNELFLYGKESFEVMAGRPNATFSEADWLGGYVGLLLVVISALIASPAFLDKKKMSRFLRYVFSFFLFFGFVALLLSVSRSAWLATGLGIVTIFFIFAWQNGVWRALIERNRVILVDMLHISGHILLPLGVAFLAVYSFHLSPFDLLDRSKSTATGEQKITVACEKEIALPRKVATVAELVGYGCEHIRLEERDTRQAAGEYVTEIFRDDPNVHIRGDIYRKVGSILREHPFFGIGFGNVSTLLGSDERGTGLNASNIFLEVWLGAGIVGFFTFLFFWFGLGILWFYRGVQKFSPLAVILIPLWVTLTLFNLFNSGLLLGFLFVFLALFLIKPSYEQN